LHLRWHGVRRGMLRNVTKCCDGFTEGNKGNEDAVGFG
jgi:hypothetical protein